MSKKIDVLLKCIPESPFKNQLIEEIERLKAAQRQRNAEFAEMSVIIENLQAQLRNLSTEMIPLRKRAFQRDALRVELDSLIPVAVTGGGQTYQDLDWLDDAPQCVNGTILYAKQISHN